MKKQSLVAFLLLSLASPLMAGEYLIICSGQSNMAWYAKIAELPDELKDVPANVVCFKQPDVTKPLEPLTTFADSPKFGPVPSFVHALSAARPKDKFIVLWDAVGGIVADAMGARLRPLRSHGVGEQGGMTPDRMQKVGISLRGIRAAARAGAQDYPGAKPLAFLWIQGESDKGRLADGYLENFKRLVANVRRDTGAPDLFIVPGEPGLGGRASLRGVPHICEGRQKFRAGAGAGPEPQAIALRRARVRGTRGEAVRSGGCGPFAGGFPII